MRDGQTRSFEESTPLPADPGGEIEASDLIPSLSRTRYNVLMSSALTTGGLEPPAPDVRVNVTVSETDHIEEYDPPILLPAGRPLSRTSTTSDASTTG